MSKPARCRPPWKRACSIFTQRLETTSRPAVVRDLDRLVAVQAELHPERARAGLDRLARDARQLVGAPEDVDDVGRRPAGRPATGSTARRGSRTRSA